VSEPAIKHCALATAQLGLAWVIFCEEELAALAAVLYQEEFPALAFCAVGVVEVVARLSLGPKWR